MSGLSKRLSHFEWLAGKKAARTREAILHGASFLLVLLVMAAGHGQLVAYPFWSAVILFLFGCGYAIASVVFKEPNCVYPKLALWTFAFFLVCYGLGMSPVVYPPVATIVIWRLWYAAGSRSRDARFNTALYRGVFLSTVFFGLWAIFYNYGQREVPAATFLIYGLSMVYFHSRRPCRLYGYCAAGYLSIGAMYAASDSGMLMPGQMGPAVQLVVGLLLLLAVMEHGRDRFSSAKPYYIVASLLTGLCLIISVWGARFLLDQFALMALTLGVPFLLFRFQRVLEKQEDLSGGEAGWEQALLCSYMSSLYAAMVLIIVAPLLQLGHALWSSFLLAALSLMAVILESQPGFRKAPRGHMHRAALFVGISMAWSVGGFRGSGIPDALGLAIAAVMWTGIWFALKKESRYSSLSMAAADSQATITALLVCVVVFTQQWSTSTCIASAVCMFCSLVVVAGKGRLLAWVSVAASAAILAVAAAGMGTPPFGQWQILTLLAVAGLVLAYARDRSERASAMYSVTALVMAVSGMSVALGMSGGEKAVMCLSASLGVPIALSALFCHQRKTRAVWSMAVVNALGIILLLWVGRVVTVAWLGAALLLLVSFFSTGWFKTHIWSYACGAAAFFALGAMLVVGGTVGVNWMFMLAAAVVCTMLVRVKSAPGDDSSRNAVVAVGHGVAIYAVLTLCGGGDAATQWQTALPLVIFGAAYWFGADSAFSGYRAIAWVFFSLALLPAAVLLFGIESRLFLVVPAVLVPVWALAGAVGNDEKSKAAYCHTSALLGMLLCLMSAALGSSLPFVFCLAGFLICLITRGQRFYVHLVLLAMAIMGYGWIRQFGSHFTHELFFFVMLVIGTAMFIELSPYLWKYLDRVLCIPFVRLFSWRGLGLGAILGTLIALVCLFGVGIAATEHPSFCKSCHIMDKYFDAWEHSSHKDVACIKCHYEPGFKNHVKGKLSAISEVAAYATHRYEHKQHGEVSNATCQRPGCHVDIDQNTAVLYEGTITFNHQLHSTSMASDRPLPCITCHSEEIKGEHLRIASSVCFLCHFHGDGPAVQRTNRDCKMCHDAPTGTITMGESTFNHREFFHGRKGVDCHACHKQVNEGDSSTSTIRCRSCHYGDKLGTVDLTDVADIHERHVYDEKVGCFECHGVLRHGQVAKMSLADAGKCADCHVATEQHVLQGKIYMGTAVADIPGEPNIMFEAGMSCSHCHTQEKKMALEGHEFKTHVSTAESCAVCHGDDDYKEMCESWQEDTKDGMATLLAAITRTRARLSEWSQKGGADAAEAHLKKAESLYHIVKMDGSFGVHNTSYIDDIIDRADREVKEAEKALDMLKDQTQLEAL